MIDEVFLAKVRNDIREAGYEYACLQYYAGRSSAKFKKAFEEWDTEVTKENLEEHFLEAAYCHGLQEDVWEPFAARGPAYTHCLELLDRDDEVATLFCEGGERRIAEIMEDA